MTRTFNPRAFRLAVAALLAAVSATAETYTVLHTFDYTNGAYPAASLLLSGNTLYGTTRAGGLGGGIVFKVNLDGTGFANLHSFSQAAPLLVDGGFPFAGGLILSGTTLYGTTVGNGAGDNGTVFAINIDGSDFTNLYLFSQTSDSGTNSDGAHPYAALLSAGNKLYGTTAWGGNSGHGTVFSLNPDGSAFDVLFNFQGGSDGSNPKGGLILQSNVLYGTTASGGNGEGTIFAVNIDGTAFRTIHSFSETGTYTNSDGERPWPTLVVSEDSIYGVATSGGLDGYGTLFRVGIDGSNFTLLHTFAGGCYHSSCDGQLPAGGLILSNDTLYGTTMYGGAYDNGIIYSIKVDGTEFRSLYVIPQSTWSFPFFNFYGAVPFSGVVLGSNVLYGTTAYGGDISYGVVYSFSLEPLAPPQLTTSFTNDFFGPAIILTWPTNIPGFPPITLEHSPLVPFTSHSPIFMLTSTNDGWVIGRYPIKLTNEFFRIFQRW